MSNALERSCPANMTPGEWAMDLEDRAVEIPTYRQPVFAEDHSRLTHLALEDAQRQRARIHAPHLELDALCLTAQLKHADAFWRHVLTTKLDSLFSIYEKALDYDRTDDHKNKCKQLANAKLAAGYDVHAAR